MITPERKYAARADQVLQLRQGPRRARKCVQDFQESADGVKDDGNGYDHYL